MTENKLVKYFSKITTLSAEESAAIAENMGGVSFTKGSYLLREGQKSINTYFVLEGCLREFIVVDGEEKTTNFFTEDQWVISLSNFSPQEPNMHNLVCVEDTTVVIGNEQAAQRMFEKFPRFETISRVVVEAVFAEQRKQFTSFLTDSPEQRYLTLLKTRPDLFQRIPQYHLASYIGVQPESLSRIRKRVMDKLREE
jgi:CRP-like cAMP-binding protein